MSMTDEITTMVEKNATQEAFDFDSYITAGAIPLPRETVDCFTDLEAGAELMNLQYEIDQYTKANGGGIVDPADDAEMVELLAKKEAVAQRIWQSAFVFELRGVAPAVQKIIQRENRRKGKSKDNPWDDEERGRQLDLAMFKASIQRVTVRSNGHVQEGPLELGQIDKLLMMLPDAEEEKLNNVLRVLLYGIPLLDARVSDAGFLSGGADSAS